LHPRRVWHLIPPGWIDNNGENARVRESENREVGRVVARIANACGKRPRQHPHFLEPVSEKSGKVRAIATKESRGSNVVIDKAFGPRMTGRELRHLTPDGVVVDDDIFGPRGETTHGMTFPCDARIDIARVDL